MTIENAKATMKAALDEYDTFVKAHPDDREKCSRLREKAISSSIRYERLKRKDEFAA